MDTDENVRHVSWTQKYYPNKRPNPTKKLKYGI